MEVVQVKTYLTGDLLKRFEEIKEKTGIQSDAETLRHCIKKFPMNGEGGE